MVQDELALEVNRLFLAQDLRCDVMLTGNNFHYSGHHMFPILPTSQGKQRSHIRDML